MSGPYTPFPQGGEQPGYGQPVGSWQPTEYLHGAPVGFGDAVSLGFKHMFTFRGRISRSAFWWFMLGAIIIDIVAAIIGRAAHAPAIQYVIEAIIAIATIGLQVRRLHDTNRTGWWWWIGIIPIIGGIVLLVFDCLPGTPGPNKYDPV